MKENEKTEIILPARKSATTIFLLILFAGICTYLISQIVAILFDSFSILLLIFSFVFFYTDLTSLFALSWVLFGKEKITVTPTDVCIQKTVLFTFSKKQFNRKDITAIYVNFNDYKVNPVSRGQNDFLSILRIGTIHFTCKNKKHHIAEGMTEQEAEEFLLKTNLKPNKE